MAKIKGLSALSRQLRAMGPAVGGKTLRTAAMTATLPVLRQAEATAPVRDTPLIQKTYKGNPKYPGYLSRNIIRKSLISRDKSFVRVMIGPTAEAFYGSAFVELGSSKMAAQPFLAPALQNNQDVVVDRLSKSIKRAIKKAAKTK